MPKHESNTHGMMSRTCGNIRARFQPNATNLIPVLPLILFATSCFSAATNELIATTLLKNQAKFQGPTGRKSCLYATNILLIIKNILICSPKLRACEMDTLLLLKPCNTESYSRRRINKKLIQPHNVQGLRSEDEECRR